MTWRLEESLKASVLLAEICGNLADTSHPSTTPAHLRLTPPVIYCFSEHYHFLVEIALLFRVVDDGDNMFVDRR